MRLVPGLRRARPVASPAVSLVRILLLAVALHVASTGIGALLLLPARSLSPTLRRAIRPLGGLVLLPLLVWWWVQWVHRPARELAWPIRIVALIGVAVLVREQRSRRRSRNTERELAKEDAARVGEGHRSNRLGQRRDRLLFREIRASNERSNARRMLGVSTRDEISNHRLLARRESGFGGGGSEEERRDKGQGSTELHGPKATS